jgi:hypothetical protein
MPNRRSDLDVEVNFDRSIMDDGTLDSLQLALQEFAPSWMDGLRIYQSSRDQRPIDGGTVGTLKKSVIDAALERGPTYQRMVATYGSGSERSLGSAELRGKGSSLIVVVSMDEDPFATTGDALTMRNSIALQLRASRIEGAVSYAWANAIFERLCTDTAPYWGAVMSSQEHWAKVMFDGPRIAAIGRDFSKYVPGVFASNFFGTTWSNRIGSDRLLSAPALRSRTLGNGIVVTLRENPTTWDAPPEMEKEHRVISHLGARHFFSKTNLD